MFVCAEDIIHEESANEQQAKKMELTTNNRYTKYRWTLRLKTRQNPKDPSTADEYFC